MEEMTQRFSHSHALYRTDNSAVFDDIEAATRGTKYASSIAPHKSPFKDGCGAFMAIKSQHAGPAMWDAEYKTQNDFMINRYFTGGTSLTLERYLAQHCQAHTAMQRYAENIQCQVSSTRPANSWSIIHLFGYLKKHHNAEMPFDPTEPEINEEEFELKTGLEVSMVNSMKKFLI